MTQIQAAATTHTRFFRPGHLAAVAAAAALALASAMPARAMQDTEVQPVSVAGGVDLAARMWDDSLQRDREGVYTILRSISASGNAAEKASNLTATVETYLDFLRAQGAERLKTFNESMEKLDGHLKDGNLREGLGDALAAHEASLEPDELLALQPETGLPFKDAVLADPRVIELVTRATKAARDAESAGEWIVAQDLFYRLNTLVDHRYQKDLDRVSYRLGLLRLYAPARLDELMNAQLVAIGEKPRPRWEHQELDTWDVHLAGVDRAMVNDVLYISATKHLSQTGYPALLVGGLGALETLVTTTDLKETFPGLSDARAVQKFTAFLREESDYWQRQAAADRSRASRVIERIEEKNAETVKLPPEVLYHEFGDGCISVLDPFTDIVWPDELQVFRRQLEGSFSGVGIQIIIDENNQLTIVTPLKDSPAHRAGIQAGDDIVAVDGRSTVGITTSQAIDQITGPKGTPVTLTVRREGEPEPIDYRLVRADIPIETVKGWKLQDGNEWDYFMNREQGVGYIRLTGFMQQTVDDFDMAIAEMGEDLQGLVIDLRYNPGGQLQAVIDLCNRFVSRGVIVSTEGPGKKVNRVHRAMAHRTAERLADIPVVVLINEGSASASEIMAGCLRDHQRAVVVGTRSYGKGSVQQISNRVDGGNALLRITLEHYLLPNGDEIHREPESTQWGVEPHITVRMTPKQIGDSLTILRDVDVLPDAEAQLTPEQAAQRDPNRLLTEDLDLQLQTAVVLIQSRLENGTHLVNKVGNQQ
ncbi:MAG: S41 family peptidase [Phycisphaerales bacterium]|nr:S41 family peptidase [Phycisphaerales bacterium]